MAKIFAIVRQDLRIFLRNRSNLPSLLFVPAVMTIIIALVNSGALGGVPIRRLDVIDQDKTQASTEFLTFIRQANPGLTLCPMDNTSKDICGLGESNSLSETQALVRVAKSSSLALLEIPAGFGANVAAQIPTTVTFRSATTFGESQSALEAVQAALSQVNSASVASQVSISVITSIPGQTVTSAQAEQFKSAVYQQALTMQKNQAVKVDFTLSSSGPGPSMGESLQYGLGQSVPGMGTMFTLMTIFGGMAALIVERQQWTLPRLSMMPISRRTLLAGKILARFSLGLVQFLVVFIVGAIFRMNIGKDPLALVLLVIVYTLAITALSFAIGSGLKNPAQASGLGLLLTLTLAPIGGAWWPMDISPRFLQVFGHISPIAWAMDGFTTLTYKGGHLVDVLLPMAILLGMTIVCFLIAIPRFKFQVE